MQIFRGFHHPGIAPACALTIGNFDGVHRGHQAMLALLNNEARHRGVPSCVLTFEPHPRDFFAALARKPELAPARIATLRDKLTELARCGVEQCVVLAFDSRLSSQVPQAFIDNVLVRGLGAKYVLVGDDFRFGAKRAGDYAMLDAAGAAPGFRRGAHEQLRGARRARLQLRSAGCPRARRHGRRGRAAGPSLQHQRPRGAWPQARPRARLQDPEPALFALEAGRQRHLRGAGASAWPITPLPGVANLGIRPSLDPDDVNGGRVLLETHCLEWPAKLGSEGAYGKIIRVELLHKLHDELKYDGLDALKAGIARDCDEARAYFASTRRQTTRDRI